MSIGYIKQSANSVPTPPSGEQNTFIDIADDKFKKKLDDGTIVNLEGGSAGVSSFNSRNGSVTSSDGDYDASQIVNAPHGAINHNRIQGAINHLEDNKAPISHVGSKGVSSHAVVDGTDAGFMSPTDKSKLDSIANAATANDTDANLKNRANHTGTQLAGTISDFSTASDARVTLGINAHVIEADPHPQYTTTTEASAAAPVQSVAGKTGVVTLNKSDVGLSNVDNTSDANKPVSSLQGAAISQKVAQTGDTMLGALIMAEGAGEVHLNLRGQSVKPSTPVNGVALYADANEQLAFIGQTTHSVTFDDTLLSEDRVIVLPDSDIALFNDPTTTTGDLVYRDVSGVAALPIGSEDFLLRSIGGKPSWQEENLGQDFGGGSDGNLTLNGVITLLNPAYYNTLTMVAGGRIITNGYPLYCKTLDLSNCDVGCIQWNGNNGASISTQAGASGGAALGSAMFGGSGAGGSGGTGTLVAGNIGVTGGGGSPSNGGTSGAGGAGGAGVGGAGGAQRAQVNASLAIEFDRFETQFTRGVTLITGGAGGVGGSSGGGSGTALARGGGGGGAGGGLVAIYAQEITTSASTPSNAIQAHGGNGGSSTGVALANCGGSSGGGGGGGGYVYIAFLKRTGPVITSLVSVNGGNAGNGSDANGTGIGANGAWGGYSGRIRIYDAVNSTSISIAPNAGGIGGVASGIVSGLGGAGGVGSINF